MSLYLPPTTVSTLAQDGRAGRCAGQMLDSCNARQVNHRGELAGRVGTGLCGLGGRKMSGRESASAHGNLEFRKWSTSACWPCTLAYVTSHTCGGTDKNQCQPCTVATVGHAAP